MKTLRYFFGCLGIVILPTLPITADEAGVTNSNPAGAPATPYGYDYFSRINMFGKIDRRFVFCYIQSSNFRKKSGNIRNQRKSRHMSVPQ